MQNATPQAGGIFLVIAIVAGTGIGIALGQPSIGFLAGLAAGAIAAMIVWRRDRRR